MNAHISIRVEFSVGDVIEDCIIKAIQKSVSWDVDWVIFSYNEIEFHISRDCDIDYVMKQFGKKFTKEVTKVIVS